MKVILDFLRNSPSLIRVMEDDQHCFRENNVFELLKFVSKPNCREKLEGTLKKTDILEIQYFVVNFRECSILSLHWKVFRTTLKIHWMEHFLR